MRQLVTQYVRLPGKLLGTNFSEANMRNMKPLSLWGHNILLVHYLGEVIVEAKIPLLQQL